jgi:activator of HSP90 ATPase
MLVEVKAGLLEMIEVAGEAEVGKRKVKNIRLFICYKMLVEDKAETEEAIEIMTEVDGEAEVDKRKVNKF